MRSWFRQNASAALAAFLFASAIAIGIVGIVRAEAMIVERAK